LFAARFSIYFSARGPDSPNSINYRNLKLPNILAKREILFTHSKFVKSLYRTIKTGDF